MLQLTEWWATSCCLQLSKTVCLHHLSDASTQKSISCDTQRTPMTDCSLTEPKPFHMTNNKAHLDTFEWEALSFSMQTLRPRYTMAILPSNRLPACDRLNEGKWLFKRLSSRENPTTARMRFTHKTQNKSNYSDERHFLQVATQYTHIWLILLYALRITMNDRRWWATWRMAMSSLSLGSWQWQEIIRSTHTINLGRS